MDFMKDLEEVAGAVAAVEGMKKVDPNAGLVTEAAAAITGYHAAGGIGEKIEEMLEHKSEEEPQS
jgi:hypothetical protein